jgi:corrinoid protein of di/trimethylamine methyltransferase
MTVSKELYEAILEGNAKTAVAITQKAIADGISPTELITETMIPAMAEVGRLFEAEEYFVPEMLIAGRAMKSSMELLKPLMVAAGTEPIGRVVIGTVKGDLHDIGKNLVASMLEGGGFEVIDVGTDVSPEKFIESLKEHKAKILALSALLTVTMPAMKTTIEALKAAGVREQVKVIIGGAPVTQQYAREIGADGYCENANSAVALARGMLAA